MDMTVQCLRFVTLSCELNSMSIHIAIESCTLISCQRLLLPTNVIHVSQTSLMDVLFLYRVESCNRPRVNYTILL